MRTLLVTFIKREKRQLERLSPRTRALLLSFVLYAAGWPLIWLFGNAFLWRKTVDPIVLGLFNFGIYAGMIPGTYFNAFLLRSVKLSKLYGASFASLGVVMLAFILYASLLHPAVLLAGLILGFFFGMYWCNRIYLTLTITHERERHFFFGLEGMINTVLTVVTPVIFGFLIQHSFFVAPYLNESTSYTAMLVVTALAFIVAGWKMSELTFECPFPRKIFAPSSKGAVGVVSAALICRGVGDAANSIIPVIVAMTAFAGEAGLGTLQSGGALVTAVTMYIIGRNAVRAKTRSAVLFCAAGIVLIAAVPLVFEFSKESVLWYMLLNGLGTALVWQGLNPAVFLMIEKCSQREDEWMGYICLRELFLESSRVIVLGVLLLVLWSVQGEALMSVLAWGAVGAGCLQFGLYFLVRRLNMLLLS